MKKIVALIMALALALSCTAFAEPTKTATQTTAQLYINPMLLAGAPEQAVTLIETINSLQFVTTKGENYTTVSFGANDTQVQEYTVASVGEFETMFFNSLYPNTAILLDMNKIGVLVETAIEAIAGPVDWDELLLGAQSAADEVMVMVEPYLADVMNVIYQVLEEVQMDDTGANMYLSITTKHIATLLNTLITRLSTDYTAQSVLAMVYGVLTQNSYDAPSFDEFLAALAAEVAQLESAEAMEIGSVGIYTDDESTTLEICLGNVALLYVDTYVVEGADCLDAVVVLSEYGTYDWNATIENIYNGTGSDVLFGISVMEDLGYTYAQGYLVAEGQSVTLSLEETIENIDTDDQVITSIVSLDLAQGEEVINLGGIATETVLVEDAGIPSVEDKYVLDVLALPFDFLMNGLPGYVENIIGAMPEAVQLVIDELAQIEGLEFLQSINLLAAEEEAYEDVTATESMDEIAPATVVTDDDEIVPATVVTNDDEIAPQTVLQDNVIEDM